ncbi:MAG: DUF2007 domain-containing protein [Anaerolineales bacterium]|jgi:hypothetical protein
MSDQIECVAVVYGLLEGDICRSLLEGNGIPVMLSSEAASSSYRVNVGTFGRIEVYVPASRGKEAREILAEGFRSPGPSSSASSDEEPSPSADP